MKGSLGAAANGATMSLALGLAASGCSLLFDAGTDPGGSIDGGQGVVDGAVDATPTSDAAYVATCGPGLPGTIELFSFSSEGEPLSSVSSLVSDVVGRVMRRTGALTWTESLLVLTSGPGNCGDAMKGTGPDGSFVRFPSTMARNALSFDFWFYAESVDMRGGLLTKDGSSAQVGDMSLQVIVASAEVAAPHHVVLRLQLDASEKNFYLCSSPIEIGTGAWHHVAASFDVTAGAKLFVDGELAEDNTPDLDFAFGGQGGNCGDVSAASVVTVEENNRDWILGASNHNSDVNIVKDELHGAIDEVRFRREPFTAAEAQLVYTSQTGL